ncbi:outer membrane beta-barrel protein [Helicobacter bizzozeronii]|uniref:outer membrane beta-barrel protein n=1 Tax=Helicobacter bizzozeronii TaxID=56877 RepID=UPI001F46EEB7|nr:outer membrane beta-barrel protein [Helicobacter bizzozeronii]
MPFYEQSAENVNKTQALQSIFSPTYVQFVVNMGFRTNLTKHQGFEFWHAYPQPLMIHTTPQHKPKP